MYIPSLAEAVGFQTLIAVVLSATLMTTSSSQANLVVSSSEESTNDPRNDYDNNNVQLSKTDDSYESIDDDISYNSSEDDSDDDDDDDDSEDYDAIMWPVLCPPNTFFSIKENNCTTCSSCPGWVVEPCQGYMDTRCGPIPEDIKAKIRLDFTNSKRNPKPMDGSNSNKGKKLSPDTPSNNNHKKVIKSKSDVSLGFSSETFKVFIIVSVAFLCVWSIIITITTCYLKRRTKMTDKEISCQYGPAPQLLICPAEIDKSENNYV